jgi:hypothetical protein
VRRILTWLVVGGVAVIGVAATADALRGGEAVVTAGGESTATDRFRAREAEHAVLQLREAGATGVLTYSDEDCRLHAVGLPDLEPAPAPRIEMCEPYTGTGGIGVFDGDVVWSGLGYQAVQVVLTQEELNRLLGRDDLSVRQAVSLGPDMIAVLADGRDGAWIVSIHEGRRVVRAAGGFNGERVILRPSPRGGYLAVLLPREPALQVADRAGRAVPLPTVTRPHAITWSPDERWTAVATDGSVYVFPTGRTGGPLVRIPLAVRALAWEAAE